MKMEFNNLPSELCKLIVSFFNVDTRLVARVANKQWYNLIDEQDFVTFMVSKDQIEGVVDTFSRCTKPIYLSFLKNKFRDIGDLSKHITKLTSLTGLEIEHSGDTLVPSDWMSFSVLTDLQYFKVLQGEGPPIDLYAHLKGLTTIEEFRPKTAADLVVLTNLSKLQSFEINFKEEYNPFNLIQNTSVLTKFTAIGETFNYTHQDLNPYVTSLKDLIYDEMSSKQLFPVAKLTKLESLGITAFDIDEYPANLTALSVSDVHPRYMTNLTNLKFLRINFNEFWPEVERRELFSYIKSLNLKELIINNLEVIDDESGSNYFKELAKLTNLEYLTLNIVDPIKVDQISQSINSLVNLVELDLNLPVVKNAYSIPIGTHMTNLKVISSNRIIMFKLSDPMSMTSLRSLSAQCIQLPQNLEYLTQLARLENIKGEVPYMAKRLTNFQQLTYLSMYKASSLTFNAIGQLTNLENLTIPVTADTHMEGWTNLNKLTWLTLDVEDAKGLENLTLLTSLQCLDVTMDSENEFRLDAQKLFASLPNLYLYEPVYY